MSRYFLHHALLPLVAEVLILNTEFTPWWVIHWLVDIIPQGSGTHELCLLFPSFICDPWWKECHQTVLMFALKGILCPQKCLK